MTERGLRETKKEATAQALAQAAFELALERGLDGFVIDDVVRRAGYSRRTFANHFSCKEEAIASVLYSGMRDSEEFVSELPKGMSLVDVLHTSIQRQLGQERLEQLRSLVSLCCTHPALVPFVLEAVMEARQATVAVFMKHADGRYPKQYVDLLSGMAYGALAVLFFGEADALGRGEAAPAGDTAVPFEEFLETTMTYLRTGFE
jgi:AcrR family transcriptional regulator